MKKPGKSHYNHNVLKNSQNPGCEMILGQALKMLIQSYGFGSFLKCLAFDPSQITPEC